MSPFGKSPGLGGGSNSPPSVVDAHVAEAYKELFGEEPFGREVGSPVLRGRSAPGGSCLRLCLCLWRLGLIAQQQVGWAKQILRRCDVSDIFLMLVGSCVGWEKEADIAMLTSRFSCGVFQRSVIGRRF